SATRRPATWSSSSSSATARARPPTGPRSSTSSRRRRRAGSGGERFDTATRRHDSNDPAGASDTLRDRRSPTGQRGTPCSQHPDDYPSPSVWLALTPREFGEVLDTSPPTSHRSGRRSIILHAQAILQRLATDEQAAGFTVASCTRSFDPPPRSPSYQRPAPAG